MVVNESRLLRITLDQGPCAKSVKPLTVEPTLEATASPRTPKQWRIQIDHIG